MAAHPATDSILGAEAMRIVSDRNKCQGHARCAAEAPDVFVIDDLGFTTLDGAVDVDDNHSDAVRRAAEDCPEGVYTIDDGSSTLDG